MSLALIMGLAWVALFFAMLAFAEIGARIGAARLARHPDVVEKSSAAEGAVFGLLGLLIAFTFSGAASRFEDRRQLVGQEANAIGTAYLRLDVLPGDVQPEMRDLFRRYVDIRTTVYQAAENTTETLARLADAEAMQAQIWKKAIDTSRRPDLPPPVAMFLLGSLNDMIDMTTTRAVATQTHPPLIIFYLLGGLCVFGALLVGQGQATTKGRSWFYPVIFSFILSAAVYVIVDIEYPRAGFVRVDTADQVLIDLRKSMQ